MPHTQTTKILSAWINSCITEEQLATCREAISEFFIKRFVGEIHEADYEHDLNALYGYMHKREAFINSQPKVTAMAVMVQPEEEVFNIENQIGKD